MFLWLGTIAGCRSSEIPSCTLQYFESDGSVSTERLIVINWSEQLTIQGTYDRVQQFGPPLQTHWVATPITMTLNQKCSIRWKSTSCYTHNWDLADYDAIALYFSDVTVACTKYDECVRQWRHLVQQRQMRAEQRLIESNNRCVSLVNCFGNRLEQPVSIVTFVRGVHAVY